MQIRIAERLKELRKQRGCTQEELANFLRITVQAMSKWERSEGMPDIAFLPQIAGFFAVSVDTLLGVDEAAKDARIRELTDSFNALFMTEKQHPDGTVDIAPSVLEQRICHIRSALREIPDCWFFMQLLASELYWYAFSKENQEKTELLDEAEGLCRHILHNCPEDRWRHCATEILCMILYEQGNNQQAVSLARNLPGAAGSNDYMLTKVLAGEELEQQLRISLREFIRLAYHTVRRMQDNGFDAGYLREQEHIRVQLDGITEGIFGNGNE